jgi:chitosanase
MPVEIVPSLKTKILQIVNVFETGTKEGKYDNITVYKDGPVINGAKIFQITFGRSQTTEFGNLRRLIEQYIANNGLLSNEFKKYVLKIGKQPSLRTDDNFKTLLKRAAREDGIMKDTQDKFFDFYYYEPAYIWFDGMRFTLPLSLLVIYDSYIHSGGILNFLRQRFAERTPKFGGDEKKWLQQYVAVRHNWLKTNTNKILQKTIYRTNCFQTQINNDNWKMLMPVKINRILIS